MFAIVKALAPEPGPEFRDGPYTSRELCIEFVYGYVGGQVFDFVPSGKVPHIPKSAKVRRFGPKVIPDGMEIGVFNIVLSVKVLLVILAPVTFKIIVLGESESTVLVLAIGVTIAEYGGSEGIGFGML
ncbi:MAG: hypothetical protein ACRC7N_02230 [Clostridium sp.]